MVYTCIHLGKSQKKKNTCIFQTLTCKYWNKTPKLHCRSELKNIRSLLNLNHLKKKKKKTISISKSSPKYKIADVLLPNKQENLK